MRIAVIDGQGGGIGRSIVEQLSTTVPSAEITAVGTNAMATSVMLKAGANFGATGENAFIYNCSRADIITGPMGIILANAMLGEISPKMACAVSGSSAIKLLIPISACGVRIAGLEEKSLSNYILTTIEEIKQLCESGK